MGNKIVALSILFLAFMLVPSVQSAVYYTDIIKGGYGGCTSEISVGDYFSSPYSTYIETFDTGDYCYMNISQNIPENIDDLDSLTYMIKHTSYNDTHPSGAMASMCIKNGSNYYLSVTSSSENSVGSWSTIDTVTGGNMTGAGNNVWWVYGECDSGCDNCNLTNPLVGSGFYNGGNFSQVKEYLAGSEIMGIGIFFGVVGIYNGYGAGYIDNIIVNDDEIRLIEDYNYEFSSNETSEFSCNYTTDFSSITNWSSVNLTLDADNGMINWSSPVDLEESSLMFNSYVSISHNSITVDTSNMPELNNPATLTFKDSGYLAERYFNVYRNGALCPTSICTEVSVTSGNVMVTVNQMSEYSLIDTIQTQWFYSPIIIIIGAGVLFFILDASLFTDYNKDSKEIMRELFLSVVSIIAIVFILAVFVAM